MHVYKHSTRCRADPLFGRVCYVGAGQLQDLHTKLVLDHPRGEAEQLHKCIVSASTGRGVFDGNVKVSMLAAAFARQAIL